MGEHLLHHPLFGKLEEPDIEIIYEGKKLKARRGQTVGAALMANNIRKLGISRKLNQSRGLYCNDGRCHSCYMTIDNVEHVKACQTLVHENMKISNSVKDPDVRSK